MKKLIAVTLIALSPFLLAACNSETEALDAAPPPAVKETIAEAVASVTASQILAVAGGGVIASGDSGPFPLTISGGDGFQANPVEDASFETLINGVRTALGVTPVTYNAQLNAAAQAHSDDMLAQDYFSHTGKDGLEAWDRAEAAGYKNWKSIGENIARGQENENLAMNGWISSPGHQRNNVDPSFDEFGLGRAGTGLATRWTLMLGSQ